MDMSFSKLQEMVKARETWFAAVHGVTKSWTQLSDIQFSLALASSSSQSLPSLQPHGMVDPSHYHAFISEAVAYLSEHLVYPSHGMDSSHSV